MDANFWIEVVGYVGSGLVLVSFLMTSVVKLRIINSIGCVIFSTYALIIHSYPTAIMNIVLFLINLFQLRRMFKVTRNYDLIAVDQKDTYMHYVMNRYKEDVEKCFPGIKIDPAKINRSYVVCFEDRPAGILLGEEEDGILDIALDYATPDYRDASVGKFLAKKLPEEGIFVLRYRGPDENHKKYLNAMGFEKGEDGYVKRLA